MLIVIIAAAHVGDEGRVADAEAAVDAPHHVLGVRHLRHGLVFHKIVQNMSKTSSATFQIIS